MIVVNGEYSLELVDSKMYKSNFWITEKLFMTTNMGINML